jgi:queuosine precursor transporter
MSVKAIPNQYIIKYPKFLFILILSYSMFVMTSNWYDSRFVEIFGISTTPGALLYSITFLQSNMITEVYGFKNARLAIFYALAFNTFFVFFGWFIMHLPSPENVSSTASFNDFLAVNTKIVAASFVGYCVSEPINSYIVSKLKIYFEGKYIGIRFIISILTSGVLDTILFVFIAFYGVISNENLIKLALHVWAIKSSIEILFLPISIRLSKKLKQIEQLDIYDTDTKFTIFSLDTNYTEKNNKYNELNN